MILTPGNTTFNGHIVVEKGGKGYVIGYIHYVYDVFGNTQMSSTGEYVPLECLVNGYLAFLTLKGNICRG